MKKEQAKFYLFAGLKLAAHAGLTYAGLGGAGKKAALAATAITEAYKK
jgi:hypothetical protein